MKTFVWWAFINFVVNAELYNYNNVYNTGVGVHLFECRYILNGENDFF